MKRRDVLVERLRAMPGVVCPDIQGAFYACVKLPVDDADRFCEWLLSDFEHNGDTIMFAPASGFYATPGLGRQEIRIAYVLNTDDLNLAMDCLEAALVAYPGKTVETAKVATSARCGRSQRSRTRRRTSLRSRRSSSSRASRRERRRALSYSTRSWVAGR